MEPSYDHLAPPKPTGDATALPAMPSHTNENPIIPPHSDANSSQKRNTTPYWSTFMLALMMRYAPRGLFSEVFDKHPLPFLKTPVTQAVKLLGLNRLERKANIALARHTDIVEQVKRSGTAITEMESAKSLVSELRPIVRTWRGDTDALMHDIVSNAERSGTHFVMGGKSQKEMAELIRGKIPAMMYSLAMFLGSSALSLRYGSKVKHDINNLFAEAVAYENDTTVDQIKFSDITRSENRIVKATVHNYKTNLWTRLFSDSLFLVTTPLKSMPITDALLGVKGIQIALDATGHDTTMFEELVNFVDNKINPTNGLGQPFTLDDIFSLYQRYAKQFKPEAAFTGVIEHSSAESALWASNQVIFHRIVELMNKTYAYKHNSIVDPTTGKTVNQADFALPKFIYLLGHDLIDIHAPERTLATIEIANRYGIQEVKAMQTMLAHGQSLEDVIKRYPITPQVEVAADQKSDPIAKGSSTQLEHAELSAAAPTHHTPHITKIPESAVRRLHPTNPQQPIHHDGMLEHAEHALGQA